MDKPIGIKTIEPNKDFVEMIRMIIKQNDGILSINRILVEHFANPLLSVWPYGREEENE